MNFFAKNLIFLRTHTHTTQVQLASGIKVGQSTVGNWEKGRTEPTLSEFLAIAQFFDIPVDVLLFTELEKGPFKGKGQPAFVKKDRDTVVPGNTLQDAGNDDDRELLHETRKINKNLEQLRVLLEGRLPGMPKKKRGK
jgi:putative transcriptional regulator